MASVLSEMTIEEILKLDEGMNLLVYDDATGLEIRPGSIIKGHPTIGIGRCLDRKGISEEEAMFLLKNDLDGIQESAEITFPWFKSISEQRQAVVLSMIFNIGINGFLGFKDMIAHLSKAEFDLAAEDMLASKWAHQVGPRAQRLSSLLRSEEKIL